MKRAHQSVHRTIWPVLAVLVSLGLVMSLVLRAPPPVPAAAEVKP